jgi:hypothetical protein
MTRDTATALMSIYRRLGELLNEATDVISRESDPEEQKQLRRPIGQMMAALYTDLQVPVIRVFPDLSPDGKP